MLGVRRIERRVLQLSELMERREKCFVLGSLFFSFSFVLNFLCIYYTTHFEKLCEKERSVQPKITREARSRTFENEIAQEKKKQREKE